MNLSRKEIIKAAVNKFLCWKLPKDFSPDSFISFDGKKHDTWGGYPNSWPTGTNLFDAEQARAMFEHCLNEVLQSRLAEGEQEPTLYQYRMKNNGGTYWTRWDECTEEIFEQYLAVPKSHGWTHEVRTLYAAPQGV